MAEKLKIEVEVTKEAWELMEGLKGVVESVQRAMSDGWQTGEDVPKIIVESLSALVPAVSGVENLMDEAREDLEAFVTGLAIKSKEIGFLFYNES